MTQIEREISHGHGLEETVQLKWAHYPKQSTDSMQSLKLPTVFFTELKQIISQFVWKYKKPRISKANLRKKKGTGGINLPDFRLYYKATVLMKDRNVDQRSKTESPEINPHTYGHLTFDKGVKIYNGEKTISLTSGAGKTGQPLVVLWTL